MRNSEVNILATDVKDNKKFIIVAKTKVIDPQPQIPPSWTDKHTKIGDYVLVSNDDVTYTSYAKRVVVETDNWQNYLQEDWDDFPPEDDKGKDKEWSIKDLMEHNGPILVYRELIELANSKDKERARNKTKAAKAIQYRVTSPATTRTTAKGRQRTTKR